MPKNRHMSFGDMQAQKAREQNLAKLRAMMKPAAAEARELGQAAPAASNLPSVEGVAPNANSAGKPVQKPNPSKAAQSKKATSKPSPKKAVAKKAVAKKTGKK